MVGISRALENRGYFSVPEECGLQEDSLAHFIHNSEFDIHVQSLLPCASRNYSQLSPGGTKEEQRVFISSVSLERMGNSKGMLLA